MPFTSLGLSPALLSALAARGYQMPTPVQAAAIPALLQGRDLRVRAQTGSGKTAAFGLPLLQQWLQRQGNNPSASAKAGPRQSVLVLVPTRELAAQVSASLQALSAMLQPRPKVCAVFGGVSINPQMLRLRGGADFVVATPGRLLDLVAHNALHLDRVCALVLDEADRLLDLGFAEELDQVLSLLPARRQNLFFSATFAPKVQALAERLLCDPRRIDIASDEDTAPLITERAILVDEGKRTQLLRALIASENWRRVLVFVATKHAAEIVADKLRRVDIDAEPFHGVLSQGKRTQVLQDFQAGRIQVVVATDMAARGIDIPGLPVVVNYDLARSPVDHVHRIGRTGRAGLSGLAVSFVGPAMEAHFRLIEKRQGKLIARETVAGFEPAPFAPGAVPLAHQASPGTGGIKGSRPSKKDKLRAAAAAAAAVGTDTKTQPPPSEN